MTLQCLGQGDGLSTPFKKELFDLTDDSEDHEPWHIRSNFRKSFNQSFDSQAEDEVVFTPRNRDDYSISSSFSSADSVMDSLTPPESQNGKPFVRYKQEPWTSPIRQAGYP